LYFPAKCLFFGNCKSTDFFKMPRIFLLSFLLCGLVQMGKAQGISQIQATQQGDRFVITYNLTGPGGNFYDITVYCSDRPGEPLTSVTGDVEKVAPGNGKRIVWNVLADRTQLVGKVSFTLNGLERAPEWQPEVVFVEGGTFKMGCEDPQDKECESDEKPQHTVKVNSFYIAKTEVTQKQWQLVMNTRPSSFRGCDDCPVESVSWLDAVNYCKKLSQMTGQTWRLPTEAEWEYAARGGNKSKGYKYAGSNQVDEVAWHTGNSGNRTSPVAQKVPNELGLYDLSGNIFEWCLDWYGDRYYSSSPAENPTGPTRGGQKSLRGGSWGGPADNARIANRLSRTNASRSNYFGFRPVRVE
jgi:formylglycine-generating enzyme required for sulfatase activity